MAQMSGYCLAMYGSIQRRLKRVAKSTKSWSLNLDTTQVTLPGGHLLKALFLTPSNTVYLGCLYTMFCQFMSKKPPGTESMAYFSSAVRGFPSAIFCEILNRRSV